MSALEDRPARATLPGVRMVDPVLQGNFDGLCGLYSCINAVRLVLAPQRRLTQPDLRALFRLGISLIDREASLERAVTRSVTRGIWPRLAREIAQEATQLSGRTIVLQQPLRAVATMRREDLLLIVEDAILAKRAVMVFMRGKYRHYSVISGYSPASLRLFDSAGYQSVRRASCGSPDDERTLHRFHVQSMIMVGSG